MLAFKSLQSTLLTIVKRRNFFEMTKPCVSWQIATGGVFLHSMRWVSLVFAAVILQSGFSMLFPEGEDEQKDGNGEQALSKDTKITSVSLGPVRLSAYWRGSKVCATCDGWWCSARLFAVTQLRVLTRVYGPGPQYPHDHV